jgi:hypothetical protein
VLPKIVIAAANRKAGGYICRRFSPARHWAGPTRAGEGNNFIKKLKISSSLGSAANFRCKFSAAGAQESTQLQQ